MALQVDRAQSNAMNLQVLKRQDDAVMEIVDMASHVVVYEFDQSNQSWKRKEVEGCLFVVKRYSSPRFQIFVNNRLSTTNMTIPVNDSLEIDSVDTFLILRSPDASAQGGYAIYGLWFFPEEDRDKIHKLLQRIIQMAKLEPEAPAAIPPKPTKPAKQQGQPKQPKQKQQQQAQPQPQAQQQPPQAQPQPQPQQAQPAPRPQTPQTQQRSRNSRQRNKRSDSEPKNSKAPTAILQRPAKPDTAASSPSNGSTDSFVRNQVSTQEPVVQLHPAPVLAASASTPAASSSGYTPISREEGIAAGNAILGMLTQASSEPSQQPVSAKAHGPLLVPPTSTTTRSRTNSSASGAGQTSISKEQLKQTLIALLDEPQFFEQIYHAYVNRVHTRS
ncbi:hypothetical protein Poli38472_002599 [Pythium oligandrum]|uniref:mRNA-decapping enzyme-like protein n=1 Tax=Pythium oligandrum TaxID=41045 RepID=A0A8K1FMH3_PYTOL|nr:hypothetical protein Poli38472_002599 [Pythium oligandrum]|eukprot:TMW63658.1 hypothetical protein Poli38472_002599 [Pythium oligandrum]